MLLTQDVARYRHGAISSVRQMVIGAAVVQTHNCGQFVE